jgi:hypothetical protein
MGFIPLGDVGDGLREGDSISFDRIRGGIISAQQLIIAGGTEGVIRSQNFNGTDAGWAIFGDGSASFFGDLQFGADVVITGDVYAANWDGTIPANLATVDTGAESGYYLDTSTGTAQFQKLFVGDTLGHLSLAPTTGFPGVEFHAVDLTTAGYIKAGVTNIGGGDIGTLIIKAPFDGGNGPELTIFGAADIDGGDYIAMTDVEHLKIPQGTIHTAYGTAALPSHSFDVDEDSGMYRYASNEIGWATGGVVRMRLQNNGNLGISGTRIIFDSITNDTYLEADESANYWRWVMANDEIMRLTNTSNWTKLDLYDSSYSQLRNVEGTELYIDNNVANRDIYLRTHNGSAIKQRIFIDGSGDMRFADHDGTSRAWLGNSHFGNTTTGYSSSNTTDRWAFGWGATFQVHKTSGTNTLIGRDGTSGGALSFRWGTAQCGYVSLASGTTFYGTTSDMRMKGNIRDYDEPEALRRILALRLRQWEWHDGGETGMGFIAQEAHTIVPNAVNIPVAEEDTDPEGMWGMDYGLITPWLVVATQEMHDMMKKMEERIAQLEERLANAV